MRAVGSCILPLLVGLVAVMPSVTASTTTERLEALWARAEAQLEAGKDCDALATARRAVRLAPRNGDAWALLSWVYMDGNLNVTTRDFEYTANQAIRFAPHSPRAWFVCGAVSSLWGPEVEDGLRSLRHSLTLAPHEARTHGVLGRALWEFGKPEAAMNEGREAIRLQPTRSRWHADLANMLGQRNQLAEALQESREASRLATTNWQLARAHKERAWLLAYQGRGREALEEARLACALTPRETHEMVRYRGQGRDLDNTLLQSAQGSYGAITALFGEPRKAELILREVYLDFPEGAAAPARAYCLALQGRPDEAKRNLPPDEPWRGTPLSPWYAYFLVKAYQASGDADHASVVSTVFVKSFPEHPWTPELRDYLARHPAQT